MLKKFQTTILTFLLVFVSATTAYAGNFSGNDVKNVINAMSSIDDKKIPQAMVTLNSFADGDFESAMDTSGDLAVFRNMLSIARSAPGEYSHFKTVSSNNGFSSVDQWALKSDRVLMAYMLTEIPRSDLEMIVALTPDQMNLFPESDRAGILSLRKMGRQLLVVPQDDIAAFAPYATEYGNALK